ncbi:hypothetical protein J8N05_46615 (plasmid) [Streptomyces sp. BH-SS-21]|uniref:Uncharacterized protein n=1 Tax=Streptomyces liliiviolaceus TaxID=2823109 RepID=A0A940Y9P2_9ACTN|nr:hypothetical protein [Streptomyces liliiviolaceus]MBQ0855637.1 hypothetical protein [Streptomyces liliiviolaceus]
MPWEALKTKLGELKARVEYTEPFWLVTWETDRFSAHPAFLDSHLTTGALAGMVRGDTEVLRHNRVVTDGFLDREMRDVYIALDTKAEKCADVSDRIRLLRHWQSAKYMGVVVGVSGIVPQANKFAAQHASTCAEFVHAHAAFLAAGQSLNPPYRPAEDREELMRRYNLALAAAGGAQPLPTKDESAWAAHSESFVKAVQAQAAQLTFGSPQAAVGHALKHLSRGASGVLANVNEQQMDGLVKGYLTEARDKIRNTDVAAVTSALDQCAGSRTYYFGEVGREVAMVAVSPSGLAWISTYYTDGRA